MIDKNVKKIVSLIVDTINDKKGFNILALDISQISSITDVLIVAEGNVDRHVVAIAKAIEEALEKEDEKPIYIEGLENGDWVVMDYFNIMVHLFIPGLREKFQLERLWSDGQLLEFDLDKSAQRQDSLVL